MGDIDGFVQPGLGGGCYFIQGDPNGWSSEQYDHWEFRHDHVPDSIFRAPALSENQFQCPRSMNWYNLTFTANPRGSAFYGNVAARVVEGKKPAGDMTLKSEKEVESLLAELKVSEDFEVFYSPIEHNTTIWNLGISVKGTFGDHYDMDAIARFYTDLFNQYVEIEDLGLGGVDYEGEPLEDWRSLYQMIPDELRDQSLSHILKYEDFAQPVTDLDLIRTGLLLGYPIESTFSLLHGTRLFCEPDK